MAPALRPPVPAQRRSAVVAVRPETPGRRDAWLKAGVLFCGAALAGVLWAAVAGDPDAAPPPRVEKVPSDADVLYEDQYVRIWTDSPDKKEESTETPP